MQATLSCSLPEKLLVSAAVNMNGLLDYPGDLA
jgi:hypothetical protein